MRLYYGAASRFTSENHEKIKKTIFVLTSFRGLSVPHLIGRGLSPTAKCCTKHHQNFALDKKQRPLSAFALSTFPMVFKGCAHARRVRVHVLHDFFVAQSAL